MSSGDLASREGFVRFLGIQYVARRPIEAWFQSADVAIAYPPIQTTLIDSDLAELGTARSPVSPRFYAPEPAALGIAWAVAGSSLGNRSILAMLRKHGSSLPTRFLADPAMPAYFAVLRPRLERDPDPTVDIDALVQGARNVFACFEDAIARCQLPVAA